MKWPFSRKNDVSAVPAEIREYYQTERRERTGIAWLLALGTLLITIGLAALLFFGGRWAYRAVVNNDDDQAQDTAQVEQGEPAQTTPTPDAQNGNTGQVAGPATGTSSTNTTTPSGSGSTTGSTDTTGRTTTPVTGSTSTLPNTGPGNVLAIFVTVSILGFLTHRYVLDRR